MVVCLRLVVVDKCQILGGKCGRVDGRWTVVGNVEYGKGEGICGEVDVGWWWW